MQQWLHAFSRNQVGVLKDALRQYVTREAEHIGTITEMGEVLETVGAQNRILEQKVLNAAAHGSPSVLQNAPGIKSPKTAWGSAVRGRSEAPKAGNNRQRPPR